MTLPSSPYLEILHSKSATTQQPLSGATVRTYLYVYVCLLIHKHGLCECENGYLQATAPLESGISPLSGPAGRETGPSRSSPHPYPQATKWNGGRCGGHGAATGAFWEVKRRSDPEVRALWLPLPGSQHGDRPPPPTRRERERGAHSYKDPHQVTKWLQWPWIKAGKRKPH